eukprot:TRINITY_DN73954_c0_g1_i2.p1 TRINITY_DN73954_c0_g1~~TRINITY_DN73954_c0_g1_i2.p1  ORF type:complete len:2546 (+),score=415.16 TRINITY_DN73954_c0_g1_i2:63-7700(+)
MAGGSFASPLLPPFEKGSSRIDSGVGGSSPRVGFVTSSYGSHGGGCDASPRPTSLTANWEHEVPRPPTVPPQLRRGLVPSLGDGGRMRVSARGARKECRSAGRTRCTSPVQQLSERESRFMKRIFANSPGAEASRFPLSGGLHQASGGAGAITPVSPAGSSKHVITEFLSQLGGGEEVGSGESLPAAAVLCAAVGAKGSERLAKEVEELRAKVSRLETEKKKIQEHVAEREETIRRLQDDIERLRKDPTYVHPAVQRLRKIGLNTPALASLDERWSGYVMGRCSRALEISSYSFKTVFSTHAQNGFLTEESFKRLIKQFETTIKCDQLTRLWFFADADGSGKLDLFEFMRLFGRDANGEMSDEYFEVVTTHLYRRIHQRGGIRRVYALAERAAEQSLNQTDWVYFLNSFKFGDMFLTKQEMVQAFNRMNVSGTGLLTLAEIESTLETAASKCYISERWVCDTFETVAKAVQEQSLPLKQLVPAAGTLNFQEFREIIVRFLPRLRTSQLERLWKFVRDKTAEDGLTRLPTDSERVETDFFLNVVFSGTLGALAQGGVASGADGSAGGATSFAGDSGGSSGIGTTGTENLPRHGHREEPYGPAGGTGRELLEQLVGLLLDKVGNAPVEECFAAMDPYITTEHFHTTLVSRFGLQYDSMKTKQLFSLIDLDRDGKLTRSEFVSMFNCLRAGQWQNPEDKESGTSSPGKSLLATLLEEGEKLQVRRLLNRVQIMEHELGLLKTGMGGKPHGEFLTMVPEKQYHQLSIAHSKMSAIVQRLRNCVSDDIGRRISTVYDANPLDQKSSDQGRQRRPASNPLELDEQVSSLLTPNSPSKQNSRAPILNILVPPAALGISQGGVENTATFDSLRIDEEMDNQEHAKQSKIQELEEELRRFARDAEARLEALQDENNVLRDVIDSMRQVEAESDNDIGGCVVSTESAPSPGRNKMNFKRLSVNYSNIQKVNYLGDNGDGGIGSGSEAASSSGDANSVAESPSSIKVAEGGLANEVEVAGEGLPGVKSKATHKANAEAAPVPSAAAALSNGSQSKAASVISDIPAGAHEDIVSRHTSPTHSNITKSVSWASRSHRSQPDVSLGSMVAKKQPQSGRRTTVAMGHRELRVCDCGNMLLEDAVFCRRCGLRWGAPTEARHPHGRLRLAVRKLENSVSPLSAEDAACLVGGVLADRYRIETIVFLSIGSVIARCRDLVTLRPVITKLTTQGKKSKHLAYETSIMSALAAVPQVPDVYFFSGWTSFMAFNIVELLQGETLASRFAAVQKGDEPISMLEAGEIADSLCRGVDRCHQLQFLHLNLQPQSVWISSSLSRAKVYILDWELAEPMNDHKLSPEFKAMVEENKCSDINFQSLPSFHTGKESGNKVRCPSEGRAGMVNPVEYSFPSFWIKNRGYLYYMSMEQLFQFIVSNERSFGAQTIAAWSRSRMGAVAKIIGTQDIHWPERGDGWVQTATPVAMVPSGRLFEVEVLKIMTMIRRGAVDLGFRIGFTDLPPNSPTSPRDDPSKTVFCGGDCAYYVRGQRLHAKAEKSSIRDGTSAAPVDNDDEWGGRYLDLSRGLRKGDRIGFLAEWRGDVAVYLNGERVGVCPNAFEPSIVINALFGLVDLYASGTEEHLVRAVTLPASIDDKSAKDTSSMSASLRTVCKLVHVPASSALGPSCDVFACALLLLQCFRGGYKATPPPAFERFQNALTVWVNEGCSNISQEYHILAATKDLLAEKEVDLASVENPEVRSVLARATRRSRYARLKCCWDLGRMLNAATGWLDMKPDFLTSHIKCVETAAARFKVDSHYMLQAKEEAEKSVTGASEEACATESSASDASSRSSDDLIEPQSDGSTSTISSLADEAFASITGLHESIPRPVCSGRLAVMGHSLEACLGDKPREGATWDLTSFVLGHSHITRMVQVLTEWSGRVEIGVIAVSRFASEVPDALQISLLDCVQTAMHPENVKVKASEKSRRTSVSRKLEYDKPRIHLEDVALPTDSLPQGRFRLQDLIKRHVLWLAAVLVANLDLTADAPFPGEAKPVTVGGDPAIIATLSSVIWRNCVLTSLSLAGNELGEANACTLASAFEKCKLLRHLDLANNNIGAKGAHTIMLAVERGSSVTMLDLSRNSIGDDGAKRIAEPLSVATNIKGLRIMMNGIGADGGEALAESLLTCSSLTSLHLGQNRMSAEAFGHLIRATAATASLLDLDVEHNLPWPVYEENASMFQHVIDPFGAERAGHAYFSCLDSLSLRHCGVRSSCAAKIFSALSNNPRLRKLNLSWNGLRQACCFDLAAMLASSTSVLEDLDLRDNHLGIHEALPFALANFFAPRHVDGSKSIGQGHVAKGGGHPHIHHSAVNKHLTRLNLASNELTEMGANSLAEALHAFEALEELHLYHNPEVGEIGTQTLMHLLVPGKTAISGRPSLCKLRILSLAACGVGDVAARSIGCVLGLNLRLQKLDLSCNGISQTQSLAEALSCNRVLEELNLAMNSIGPAAKRLLVNAVASNRATAIRCVDVSAQQVSAATRTGPATEPEDINVGRGVLGCFVGLGDDRMSK